MSIKEKLPIDPLSSATRLQLRDRVLAQLEVQQRVGMVAPVRPMRSTRVAIGLVLVGAAAALVLTVVLGRSSTSPPLLTASSESRFVSGEAPSTIDLGSASVHLAKHSIASVEGNDRTGISVRLERGRVDCKVAPRAGRPPFRVIAAGVRVEVVGTQFAVEESRGAVSVAVSEGIVRVAHQGRELELRAGERWSSHAAAPEASPATTAEETEQATENIEMAELEFARNSHPRGGGSAKKVPEKTGHPIDEAGPRDLRTPGADLQPPTDKAVPDEVTADRKQGDRELFARATALEASAPQEAMGLYRQVEGRGGAWAPNALFARARLELAHGDKDQGRRLLRQYVERYPNAPNAAMARRLLETR